MGRPNRVKSAASADRLQLAAAAARAPRVGQRVGFGQQLAQLQGIHGFPARRPARRSSRRRTSGGRGCSCAPARCGPAVDGSKRRVRWMKNISSLRITDPLKSMTASRRHTGPIMSAGSTRRPVSSASSRTAACASVSPRWAAPPTVNHQRGAVPSSLAGSEPQNSSTAPSSSSNTTRADVRRLTRSDVPGRRLGAFGDLEIGWQRGGSAEPQQPHRGPLAQRQRVADGVVVESAGQQHPGFGVGQLGDQRHRQRRRVDHAPAPPTTRSRRLRAPAAAPVRRRRPVPPAACPPARRRRRRRRPRAPPPRGGPARRRAPARTGRSARAAGPAGWRSGRPTHPPAGSTATSTTSAMTTTQVIN